MALIFSKYHQKYLAIVFLDPLPILDPLPLQIRKHLFIVIIQQTHLLLLSLTQLNHFTLYSLSLILQSPSIFLISSQFRILETVPHRLFTNFLNNKALLNERNRAFRAKIQLAMLRQFFILVWIENPIFGLRHMKITFFPSLFMHFISLNSILPTPTARNWSKDLLSVNFSLFSFPKGLKKWLELNDCFSKGVLYRFCIGLPLLFSSLLGLLHRFSIKALKQLEPLKFVILVVLLKLLLPFDPFESFSECWEALWEAKFF